MTTSIYVLGFLGLALIPAWRAEPFPFLAGYFLLFAIFAAFVAVWRDAHGPGWTRLILVAAIAMRVIILAGHPYDLSADVARYAWDGHLLRQGLNPFALPPGDAALIPYRTDWFSDISYPEIPTIYPPVAQGLFGLSGLLGGSPGAVRLLLVLCDVAVMLLLARLLARLRLPAGRLIVYAWCPLPVVEVASSGHVEPLGVLFVLLCALALGGRRHALAGAAWAAAVLAKVGPLLLAPLVVRRGGRRAVLAAAGLTAVLVAPFLGARWNLVRALGEYGSRWRFNDLLFSHLVDLYDRVPAAGALAALVVRVFDAAGARAFGQSIASPAGAARLTVGLFLAGVAITLAARRPDRTGAGFLRDAAVLIGVSLLLAPTVHPWYLLWLLPLLCFIPSPPWILLCGTVALSYVDAAMGRSALLGPSAFAWLEYGPSIALWGFLVARSRRPALFPPAPP